MNSKQLLIASLLAAPITAYALSTEPPFVEMQTNFGTIMVELNFKEAPISSKNFIAYATKGFYTNTLFHRTVKYTYDATTNPKGDAYSIIQGGGADLDARAFKATDTAIVNEAYNGLSNKEATFAMARQTAPDSATAQFFINTRDNSAVFDKTASNAGYAVFGKVVGGYSLAQAINTVDTGLGIPLTSTYTPAFIETVYLSDTIDATKAIVRITTSDNYLGKITSTNVGKVNSTPSAIKNCGTNAKKSVCTTTRPIGSASKYSLIKLQATPVKNYIFTGWRGDCFGYGYINPIVVNLTQNYNCTATFAKLK